MRTYLITGTNRGIGLALTRLLLEKGERVIAACRNPAQAGSLNELKRAHEGRLQIEKLEVTDELEARNLSSKLAPQGIDALVNSAGMLQEYNERLEDLSLKVVEETFRVNAVGPMIVTRAMLPALQKSKRPLIVNITSRVGSIADNQSGLAYAYRMSKAALNMFNKSLSIEYPKIPCVVLHPGWVKTAMGGDNAPLEPAESAAGLVRVIESLTLKDTGKFYDFKGAEIPW